MGTYRENYYGGGEVFPVEWKILADIDESESYDIDKSRIYAKPDGSFALATASGCSCWEGDWETQDFSDLGELEHLVLYREGYVYTPSPRGAIQLLKQARENLGLYPVS